MTEVCTSIWGYIETGFTPGKETWRLSRSSWDRTNWEGEYYWDHWSAWCWISWGGRMLSIWRVLCNSLMKANDWGLVLLLFGSFSRLSMSRLSSMEMKKLSSLIILDQFPFRIGLWICIHASTFSVAMWSIIWLRVKALDEINKRAFFIFPYTGP